LFEAFRLLLLGFLVVVVEVVEVLEVVVEGVVVVVVDVEVVVEGVAGKIIQNYYATKTFFRTYWLLWSSSSWS
jgi:hypothetical protein